LAIEYSYRIREQSPTTWVFWVHASSAARFQQGFEEIAEQAKLHGRKTLNVNIFKLVRDWLRDKKNGQWDLILDNLDDDKYLDVPWNSHGETAQGKRTLRSYLPVSAHGSIIVTTRNRAVGQRIVEENELSPSTP
jgi:hypothetical protein